MLIALQRSSENDDVRLSTDKESAAHVCANQLCTLTHLPKALSADTGKCQKFTFFLKKSFKIKGIIVTSFPSSPWLSAT